VSRIANRTDSGGQNRSGIRQVANVGRIELLALRLLWLALPIIVGPSLRTALETLDSTPQLILEIALWIVWFVGLVACLTPHPLSLTMVRILAPAVVGFAVISGLRGGWGAASVAALGYGTLLTATVLLPAIGDVMVNGSAYGSERRMALRTPAVAIIGPIPIAWTVTFVGLVAWALLVADERYWMAGTAAALGAVAVWAAGRLLHQLARRWIVFVPAGFVIHDSFQLVDPVLMARAKIIRLGPAELTTGTDGKSIDDADARPGAADQSADESGVSVDRLDLSAGSLGLAVEVESSDPVLFGVRENHQVNTKKSARVVFSPTLPGALLSEARIRGIKIRGSAGVG
jgi:hypothetical protein